MTRKASFEGVATGQTPQILAPYLPNQENKTRTKIISRKRPAGHSENGQSFLSPLRWAQRVWGPLSLAGKLGGGLKSCFFFAVFLQQSEKNVGALAAQGQHRQARPSPSPDTPCHACIPRASQAPAGPTAILGPPVGRGADREGRVLRCKGGHPLAEARTEPSGQQPQQACERMCQGQGVSHQLTLKPGHLSLLPVQLGLACHGTLGGGGQSPPASPSSSNAHPLLSQLG